MAADPWMEMYNDYRCDCDAASAIGEAFEDRVINLVLQMGELIEIGGEVHATFDNSWDRNVRDVPLCLPDIVVGGE